MPKRPREETPVPARALEGASHGDDAHFDRTLRPKSFDDYVGQTKHTENLKVFVAAAKKQPDGTLQTPRITYGRNGAGPAF